MDRNHPRVIGHIVGDVIACEKALVSTGWATSLLHTTGLHRKCSPHPVGAPFVADFGIDKHSPVKA